MDRRRLWLLVPRGVRTLPADLAAVVALVALTVGAVFVPGVSDTPLRVVVGLPFVLFVPGYALVAALFPERGPDRTGEAGDGPAGPDPDPEAGTDADAGGIDGIERVALAFGTSIAVVPLLGLVLNFTPFGIRLVPVVASVGGFTLVATGVAAVRRRDLPDAERFRVPYRAWLAAARAELFEPDDRTDAALNVLLAASVVLAAASVGYAVAVPKQGESFTEFYLLTEGADGDLVADGYPTEFTAGEGRSLVVGIGNQEHERVNYTVVVQLDRVRVANDSTTVLERTELRRFTPGLAHNGTWQRSHVVTPRTTGERLRLTYLLYRDAPPATPSVDTAYREVHLWVNVSAPAGASASPGLAAATAP
jgi:uncharacterized membrane protein